MGGVPGPQGPPSGGPAMGKKLCRYCGRQFEPDPRTARFQKACSRVPCQRERKRQKLRRWRVLHPEYTRRYGPKMRAWAKAYPDYWRQYRSSHPDYSRRDQARRITARKRAKVSANETSIRRVLVEKLEALDLEAAEKMSANETPILRRMEAIEDCLRSTVAVVVSAKQTPIAAQASPGG